MRVLIVRLINPQHHTLRKSAPRRFGTLNEGFRKYLTYDWTDKIQQILLHNCTRTHRDLPYYLCPCMLNNHRHFLAKLRRLLCDRSMTIRKGCPNDSFLSQYAIIAAHQNTDRCRVKVHRLLWQKRGGKEKRSEGRVGSREGRGDNFRSLSFSLSEHTT